MNRRSFLRLGVLVPLGLAMGRAGRADAAAPAMPVPVAPDGRPHRFTLSQQAFLLDGRPLQIRSGQMDLIRIPREYWRQRIRMARAMGMNTVASYLMWNAMEPTPGRFDLASGSRDFVHFTELCAEEGMWVYLRPGPYVCAEWDFGGLPAWLLRDPETRVRDGGNKPYMDAVARYFDAIAPKLAPLMVDRGGPVLMIQLENEYASFGDDLGYLLALQRMWRERGIDGPFSISDGWPQLQRAKTYVEGAALGLDGDTDFAAAQTIAKEAPVWVGEGYTGWLSHWGDQAFPPDGYAAELRRLMESGRSFNLYEIHGGTNFGFGAGANAKGDGSQFQPVITSYDYGAPITEQGVATDAYHQFRSIIASALQRPLPDIPAAPPSAPFPEVVPQPWASIWDQLPSPQRVERPRSNEALFGQGQGMVLYRRDVHLGAPTSLHLEGVHDYATVFLDGDYVGTVSRVQVPGSGLPEGDAVMLPASKDGASRLDILIDSFGHVGYGHDIRDGKGLVGDVRLSGRVLRGWQAFALPLDDAFLRGLAPSARAARRPGVFFRAMFTRDDAVDCYVDLSAWDKGYAWVNGHLLGRYWRIGPQQRLYCPSGWWKAGDNEIVLFDQHRTLPAPVWGVRTLHDA